MIKKIQEEEVREEIPGVYEPSAGYIHVMARVQYHLDLQEEKQRRQERIDERRYQPIPKDDRWTFYDQWLGSYEHPLLVEGGSHLYGTATPESDLDVYGIHVASPDNWIDLVHPPETIKHEQVGYYQRKYEWTTYELYHFCHLLLKRNGNMLEILFSPLEHNLMPRFVEPLREIALASLTTLHMCHFREFAAREWGIIARNKEEREKRGVKHLLLVYQKLMMGIHLMEHGRVEAHLPTLMQEHPQYPIVWRTLERKLHPPVVNGMPLNGFTEQELLLHKPYYEGLQNRLEEVYLANPQGLPDEISDEVKVELNEYQKQMRKDLYREEPEKEGK